MRYLIDGYNLLYALGLARKHGGRAGWDRARRDLLDWLADRHGATAGDVTVIFDAQNSLGGVVEESHRGLRVLRDRGRTADDMIEDLLRDEKSPRTLTVVSNDGRVREAANRRGAQVLRCSEYLDELLGPRKVDSGKRPADEAAEKDVRPTPEEQAEWLRSFGGGEGS
jgi:predicted RNA-binding protein with PIN domain